MMLGFGRTKQQFTALRQEHAALIADNVEKDEKIARLDAEAQRLAERVRDLRAAEAKHMKAMAQQVRATEEALYRSRKLSDAVNEMHGKFDDVCVLGRVSPAFLAVFDQMNDELGVPAAQLAADATAELSNKGSALAITPAFANAVQRALHALGWAEFGTLRSLDDNTVCGRGYWLTGNGVKARKALRVAADHLAGAAGVQAEAA